MSRTLLVGTALVLGGAPALAHPGPHAGMDALDAAAHALRAPDHLAVILSVLAIAAVASVLSRLAHARATAERKRT